MKLLVKAPGKIILTGEHAVVYGYKAIASSINLKCQSLIKTSDLESNDIVLLKLESIPFNYEFSVYDYASLSEKVTKCKCSEEDISYEHQKIIGDFVDKKLDKNTKDFDYIKSGLIIFLDLYLTTTKQFRAMEITISSEFSYGCGMGSSAAYSTVLATSLLIVNQIIMLNDQNTLTKLQLDKINSLTLRGEKIVHGTPSGIDNSISVYGKCVIFQRKDQSMDINYINLPRFKVIIVDTGVKRCTKTIVKDLRLQVEQNENKYHRFFHSIQSISSAFEILLRKKDVTAVELAELIRSNHTVLCQLGVSHPAIENVVEILNSYGIASKLTGAGCGGCVFGLIDANSNYNHVVDHLSELGYHTHISELNVGGVDIDVTSL